MENPEPLSTPVVESIPTPQAPSGMSSTTKTVLIVLVVLLVLLLCCCLSVFLVGYLVFQGVIDSPELQDMLEQMTIILPSLAALI